MAAKVPYLETIFVLESLRALSGLSIDATTDEDQDKMLIRASAICFRMG